MSDDPTPPADDSDAPAPMAGPVTELDMTMPVTVRVLTFWFGPSRPSKDSKAVAPWWFAKNDGVDAAIITLFAKDYGDAAAGRLDDLLGDPLGGLALILILDQFPRNMFRGSPKAFAADAKARWAAEEMIVRGHDTALAPIEQMFAYLPFMHSEELVDQERSIALCERVGIEANQKSALAHLDLIERFGRFPHRNGVLGRESTPDEIEYLSQPDAGF